MVVDNLKNKILSGVFWQGINQGGNYVISFVVSIILARLLEPAQYGLLALTSIFIAISSVFIDSGLSQALIQKKNAEEVDYCSIFYLNIVIAVILYVVNFFAAPYIARYFNTPELSTILRVLSLTLIIGACGGIQGTVLNKQMLFHLNCRISWGANIPAGIIGIWMAYKGFGVWALVTHSIFKTTLATMLQWFWVRWRPQLLFSWKHVKVLFSYSWKLFVSGIIDTLYNNVYGLVISKFYQVETLSFYEKGRHLPGLGITIINSTLGGVLFPAFSSIQNDRPRIKRLAIRGLKNIMFFVIPLMTLMAIVAKPLIVVLLKEKWLPSVFFMQMSCISFIFYPFHTLNLQIITAIGRSDIFLFLEIIKKTQAVLLILLTYRYGVEALMIGMVALAPICFIENAWPNRKQIEYPFWEQFWDVLPFMGITLIASIPTYFCIQLIHNHLLTLCVATITFSFTYLLCSILFRLLPEDCNLIFVKFRLFIAKVTNDYWKKIDIK